MESSFVLSAPLLKIGLRSFTTLNGASNDHSIHPAVQVVMSATSVVNTRLIIDSIIIFNCYGFTN